MYEESFTPLDQNASGLQLERAASESLRTAGKWGRFIAIVNFVFIGLTAIGFLLGGYSMIYLALAGTGSAASGGTIFVTLFLVLMGLFMAFGIFLNYKLYHFSANAILAADTNNTQAFTRSIMSLSTLFKVFGILTAAVVAFYALMIMLPLVFGAFM